MMGLYTGNFLMQQVAEKKIDVHNMQFMDNFLRNFIR